MIGWLTGGQVLGCVSPRHPSSGVHQISFEGGSPGRSQLVRDWSPSGLPTRNTPKRVLVEGTCYKYKYHKQAKAMPEFVKSTEVKSKVD